MHRLTRPLSPCSLFLSCSARRFRRQSKKAAIKKKKGGGDDDDDADDSKHAGDEFDPVEGSGRGQRSGVGAAPAPPLVSQPPPQPLPPSLPPVRINPSLLPVDAYLGVPPKQFVL